MLCWWAPKSACSVTVQPVSATSESTKLLTSELTITWLLHDGHMTITWLPHDCHMTVTWFTWWSHDCHVMFTLWRGLCDVSDLPCRCHSKANCCTIYFTTTQYLSAFTQRKETRTTWTILYSEHSILSPVGLVARRRRSTRRLVSGRRKLAAGSVFICIPPRPSDSGNT